MGASCLQSMTSLHALRRIMLQTYALQRKRPSVTQRGTHGSGRQYRLACSTYYGSLVPVQSMTSLHALSGMMLNTHAQQNKRPPATPHGTHGSCSSVSPCIVNYGSLVSAYSMSRLRALSDTMLKTHAQQTSMHTMTSFGTA